MLPVHASILNLLGLDRLPHDKHLSAPHDLALAALETEQNSVSRTNCSKPSGSIYVGHSS